MTTLEARLKEARKNKGLTREDISEELAVEKQKVEAWEEGGEAPDIEEIPRLAKLYGVTTDWLLLGKRPSAGIVEVTSNLSDRLFNEERMDTYVRAYCNARGFHQTMRALAFAKEKHEGQFRKKGHSDERIPYIYHPLLLTCHAMALGFEEDDLFSACLLHDVCEDCGVEVEELPVNESVKEAVRLLTKPEDFRKTEEHEKAYYDAIAGNRIASVVKLLDRCNNVTGMATSFTDEHIAEYIKETQEYIKPLMRKTRNRYPEYTNQMFLIRYHMNSVLEALKHHMRSGLKRL